jgi:hypothetical protein
MKKMAIRKIDGGDVVKPAPAVADTNTPPLPQ